MRRRVRATRIDFTALRRELELPTGFPLAAVHEAERAAAAPLPAGTDSTDLALVTIDPPGSLDLDQALRIERRGSGYRVYYAIADVAAFVPAGGELAAETWRRGETIYLPDGKVPLHPPVLSEGAASLLPGVPRAGVLWTLDLDGDGAPAAVDVRRATVRSRAKLDYVGVEAAVAAGRAPEPVELLPEVGRLLLARALARGAVDLPVPEQEIEPDGSGWRLVLRPRVPIEEYNAQISLLTGMAAAEIMIEGRVGLLRTMPPPRPEAVAALRAAAVALGIAWPDGAGPGEVLAGVQPGDPRGAAFAEQAGELMRGAAYTAFDGQVPAQPLHGGVAAPYAHVTAPLRRLADRYAAETCLALVAGRPVPDWARAALAELPAVMSASSRRASAAERGAVDLVEAVLLADRVGDWFDAAVLDVRVPPPADDNDRRQYGKRTGDNVPVAESVGGDGRSGATGNPSGPRGGANGGAGTGRRAPGGTVAIDDPPVRARCDGPGLPLGHRVRVRLDRADPERREVLFHYAGPAGGAATLAGGSAATGAAGGRATQAGGGATQAGGGAATGAAGGGATLAGGSAATGVSAGASRLRAGDAAADDQAGIQKGHAW